MTESEKAAKLRERELVKAISECRKLAKDARDATPSAWTAASTLFKEEQRLRTQLNDFRAAMSMQTTPEKIAADMTPEQWAERLKVQAGNLTDPDLDVFISEWRRRNKLVAVHQQDGAIHLVRQAG